MNLRVVPNSVWVLFPIIVIYLLSRTDNVAASCCFLVAQLAVIGIQLVWMCRQWRAMKAAERRLNEARW